jgi:hypothetical protein
MACIFDFCDRFGTCSCGNKLQTDAVQKSKSHGEPWLLLLRDADY